MAEMSTATFLPATFLPATFAPPPAGRGPGRCTLVPVV